MTVAPGEIYLADIFEGGTRPVIIVSREQLNRGGLFLAVPVTASRVQERKRFANYVYLPEGSGGLREDSVAVTHLAQPVREEALQARWGQLSVAQLAQVVLGIAWSIGLVN
jgi:mRNA-degrading endonuclease toxin of MazEF toxin-antitoxin module